MPENPDHAVTASVSPQLTQACTRTRKPCQLQVLFNPRHLLDLADLANRSLELSFWIESKMGGGVGRKGNCGLVPELRLLTDHRLVNV